jgi:hypothetical protein
MDYQKFINNLTDIYNSPKPQSNKEFEKLYCNIMIYKNDIKMNVSKSLFENYKKEVDNLLFNILLYDNEMNSRFFIILKEIIEHLKSNFKFDEDHFISSILNTYYNGNGNDNGNDNNNNGNNDDEIIDFIEMFIENYTSLNSIDYNIFLINKYSNITDAIKLYKKYYKISFYFQETKTNYQDLALVVLFNKFYEKIYKIITDDNDSSNETIISY